MSVRSETKRLRHTQNGRLREGRREDGNDGKEALSAVEVDKIHGHCVCVLCVCFWCFSLCVRQKNLTFPRRL